MMTGRVPLFWNSTSIGVTFVSRSAGSQCHAFVRAITWTEAMVAVAPSPVPETRAAPAAGLNSATVRVHPEAHIAPATAPAARKILEFICTSFKQTGSSFGALATFRLVPPEFGGVFRIGLRRPSVNVDRRLAARARRRAAQQLSVAIDQLGSTRVFVTRRAAFSLTPRSRRPDLEVLAFRNAGRHRVDAGRADFV